MRLDLIGPSHRDDPALRDEILPDPPSRWYLTGFLVPFGAPPRQKTPDPQEEMDAVEEGGVDDDDTPERGPSRPRYLPSSMGLSLLVEPGTETLRVSARWGDYRLEDLAEEEGAGDVGGQKDARQWRRTQREAVVDVLFEGRAPIPLADTDGLQIYRQIRDTQIHHEMGDRRVLAVSLFLVNRRSPHPEPAHDDEAIAFQTEIEVESPTPIVARFDLSGRDGDDIDARIADLHYRDVVDWAVGHNVSVAADVENGKCSRVRTCWVPAAFVPRFVPGTIEGVELGMEALAGLADGAAARAVLGRLPERYRDWIEQQRSSLAALSPRRREVAEALLGEAHRAASRIEDGIALLSEPHVLDAFRLMKAWEDAGGANAYGTTQINPADPYMTIVAYFNALRELGSARRIVDDEVRLRASRYGSRQRIGETPRFADRTLHDALELTSRIGTAEVADTKARLGNTFDRKDPVDVALATNVISVGLDIIRLGLMLVSGQPKTVGEYIQATSRVGRDADRPGLVVALLNVHKPRDRSHYERFAYWHAGFYRAVEATSVTPFAPHALDRGLAAVAVAMARLGHGGFTPNRAAGVAERSARSWTP